MTPRTLQAVLRTLADTGPPASDAELLRRFVAGGDGTAFTELVRRYGRLVWAVCRHLTRSEAEADDAFQATFLVLVKNPKAVRDAGKLSSWLHGVAYRVCSKARLAAKRRAGREQAVARPERNGRAVPDSAWDRALAAVHEEVARLPDALRVPFVLCCLEGKGQSEAAGQLGWRVSTLAFRLAKAKDAVLARLDARGLTAGAVAGVGLAVPPPASLAKASALTHAGVAIPGSVLNLSQGVIGMSVSSVKVLAAAVMVAAGLAAGVGSGWVATAGAQPPGPAAKQTADLQAEVKRLQAELNEARAATDRSASLAQAVAKAMSAGAAPAFKSAKWEYDLADQEAAYEKGAFERLLQQREHDGWEFLGGTTGGPSGGKTQWLFRRPVKTSATSITTGAVITSGSAAGTTSTVTGTGGVTTATGTASTGESVTTGSTDRGATVPAGSNREPKPQPLPPGGRADGTGRTGSTSAPPTGGSIPYANPAAGNRVKAEPEGTTAIQAEIDRLTDKLKASRANPQRMEILIPRDVLPLPAKEVADMLGVLVDKKFGKGKVVIQAADQGLKVEGGKEAVDWAEGVVKAMSGK